VGDFCRQFRQRRKPATSSIGTGLIPRHVTALWFRDGRDFRNNLPYFRVANKVHRQVTTHSNPQHYDVSSWKIFAQKYPKGKRSPGQASAPIHFSNTATRQSLTGRDFRKNLPDSNAKRSELHRTNIHNYGYTCIPDCSNYLRISEILGHGALDCSCYTLYVQFIENYLLVKLLDRIRLLAISISSVPVNL